MPQVTSSLSNAFRHLGRSVGGNGGVASGNGRHPHRPAQCRDGDCQRVACYWYRAGREDGYDDGHDDGHDDGYREGYAAGKAAAQK